MDQKIGKKVFIKLYLQTEKLLSTSLLLDSGSDISLIHERELHKLVTPTEIHKYKSVNKHKVETFSNQAINILYNVTLPWSAEKHGPTINLTFSVYDQEVTHSLLFGQDNMQKMGMILSYAPAGNTNKPSVRITKPVNAYLETQYIYPHMINTCSADVCLLPNQTKTVVFNPHPFSDIQPGDNILVSESNTHQVHITPSTYRAYTHKHTPLVACLTNLTSKPFSGQIQALTERFNTNQLIKQTDHKALDGIKCILHEVLHTDHPLETAPTIRILEDLPSTPAEVTPLSSFLLLTPYESKNITISPKPTVTLEENILRPNNKTLVTELQQTAFNDNAPATPTTPPDMDMPAGLSLPAGYEIPCSLPKTVEELLNLEKYDEHQQKHLRDIFIDTFPTVVAVHPYDIGKLSDTLGFYKIELKDNAPLPVFKKMYYLAPHERQQMKDILDHLIKYEVIERASHQAKVNHLHASPGYLVAKPNPESSARLIVNYQLLNEAILTAPPVIPNISNTLQALRGKYMYSTSDLTSAYYSMSIHPESQPLTRFVTDFGSYHFLKLAMGINVSPACFAELTYRMIHMKPRLDSKGNAIYLEDNVVALEHDYIHGCEVFYDDLIFATDLKDTYEETVAHHYSLVKRVVERLAFHKAKLSVEKSKFGQTHIKFLGWYIAHNTLFPDRKRVAKLLDSKFPDTLQGMRSFTGLLQTIKTTLPCTFMRELAVLTPLCSSVQPYSPQPHHKRAFEQIKLLLTETPIFSRIIDPSAKKLLFVDASDKGCYSAVLCQLEKSDPRKTHIPDTLSLSDPVDRIIFDNRLCYEPVPIYTLPAPVLKSALPVQFQQTAIKNTDYLQEDFLGYSKDQVMDSLFLSIRSIQFAYGCQLSDSTQLRSEIVKKVKSSLVNHKILDFQFHGDRYKYQEFLKNFQFNQGPIDDNFHLVEVLAKTLNRPITLISSLQVHKNKHIMKFVHHSQKPPFVLGVYQKNSYIIFRPYFVNRNTAFNLKEVANTFQIVSFWSKSISQKDSLRPIVEKELYAILGALDTFSKLIGRSEVLCLTDSKALFLLFSNPVSKSSSKISRWGQKITLEYPLLKFRFISTRDNIADYLTRDYNATKTDLQRLAIGNFRINNLTDHINQNKEFTLDEWQEFVRDHEHLLTYSDTSKKTINSLSRAVKDIQKLLDPMDAIKLKMGHDNIAKEQRKEFKSIYETCLAAKDFTTVTDALNYKVSNGLLYVEDDNLFKIYLPASLEGLFISYLHLSHGHAGIAKLTAMLFPYYFPRKLHKITHLCTRCFPCALTNYPTRKHILGSFPIPQYMFEVTVADLMESLPPSAGFSHILILCCPLTNFLICYPLKDKTAKNIAFQFQYGLFQFFKVKYFLSDNGTCFTEKHFLTLLHSLHVQRVQIAALRPQSNGRAEAAVKSLKYILKKSLATFPDHSWTGILPILTKQMNLTIHPKTGFAPLALLHGYNSPIADSPFSDPMPTKLYPLLQNLKTQVQDKVLETTRVIEFIRKEIQLNKIDVQQRLNKNRIQTTFNVGDFCFVKDRSITQGVNPSLRTTFSDDPHIILQDRPTTVVVRRLADSFQSVYSKDDVKLYNRLDASFAHLPAPVKEVLINHFQDLDNLHFDTLRQHAKLSLPQGEILNPTLEETQDNPTNSPVETPNLNNPPLLSEYIKIPEENSKVTPVCGSEEDPERLTEDMPSPPLPSQRETRPVEMTERKIKYRNIPTRANKHQYSTRLSKELDVNSDSSDSDQEKSVKHVTFSR